MPSRIRIGPDGGPYVIVEEDNGDVNISSPNGNVDFQTDDISNVGTLTATNGDIDSLSTQKHFSELEQADIRVYARSDGTHDAYDDSGVIDEGVSDMGGLYATLLSNISEGTIGFFPGTYEFDTTANHNLSGIDLLTSKGVKWTATSALTNMLEIRKSGGRISNPPEISGLTVDGRGNADRLVQIDTARYGALRDINASGLNNEVFNAFASQSNVNADNWTIENIYAFGAGLGTLEAGSSGAAADWHIRKSQSVSTPSGSFGLTILDSPNILVDDCFVGNNGSDIAGGIKIASPGNGAGAKSPVSGIEIRSLTFENDSATSSAAAVEVDGSANQIHTPQIEVKKAVPIQDVDSIRLRNTAGTIRRLRGPECRVNNPGSDSGDIDLGAGVYRPVVDAHTHNGDAVESNITNNADFATINGVGREAAGSGNSPTAGKWDVARFVENTDDGTIHLKISTGSFVQV